MTIKPALIDSITVMIITLALGLASDLLFWRTRRRQGKIVKVTAGKAGGL